MPTTLPPAKWSPVVGMYHRSERSEEDPGIKPLFLARPAHSLVGIHIKLYLLPVARRVFKKWNCVT